MKILFVSIGPWNDIRSGNNILTNWFTDYPCDSAQIYVHDGFPFNNICTKYFQLTDDMMSKSFMGKKAGVAFNMSFETQLEHQKEAGLVINESVMIKRARLFPRSLVNIIRDCIWLFGRVDKKAFGAFIKDFEPDVVFCSHLFDIRFWRIERLIRRYTNAPLIAFTGDSEVSLRAYNLSPLFWIRQFVLNRLFWKHIKIFSHYFTFSESLAKEYQTKSGVSASTLYKCGILSESFTPKQVHAPIRLVYAGNLYCNRWKTLAIIAGSISRINENGLKISFDVYTNTSLSKEISNAFEGNKGTIIHGKITAQQLDEVYKNADIALHVESFDKKYRLDTIESFSTKIVDLMGSTCAIMAICWKEHNGIKYLKQKDAAICIDNLDDIPMVLNNLTNNTNIIQEYALKAWECGNKYHRREVIQHQINEVFSDSLSLHK